MTRPQLVLVNLGTPTAPTPEAVREFLAEFLSDPSVVDLPRWLWQPILRRMVLPRRPRRVAPLYRSIWTDGGSPLRVDTQRMAEQLGRLLENRSGVSAAYRYGEPSLDSEFTRLARTGAEPVLLVPLFPQRTDPTTGTILRHAREAAERAGVAGRVRTLAIAPDDAGYVEALGARWREAVATEPSLPEHVVISYHGLPVRYDRRERGTYRADCAATTRAFLQQIGWPPERATVAYQSKFGPEPWLKPATQDVLAELPARGVRRVAVVTPGFLTEGLETLEEIGIRARETFLEAGGESFVRIAAPGDHAALLRSLARAAAVALGSAGFMTDP